MQLYWCVADELVLFVRCMRSIFVVLWFISDLVERGGALVFGCVLCEVFAMQYENPESLC